MQQAGSVMSLVHWLQGGDSSMPRETDGATEQGNAKGPQTGSETEKGTLRR